MLFRLRSENLVSTNSGVEPEYIKKYADIYAQDYPEPEVIIVAAKHNAGIMEVPVTMLERRQGTSSISPLRSIYYMIKVSIALILAKISS